MGCGASTPKPAPAEPLRVGGPVVDYGATYKVVMVGDAGVGKSSLLKRFIDGKWTPVHTATIGVDFGSRPVALSDGSRAKLQIWDTAGTEIYRSVSVNFYRDARAIVVVYDVNRPDKFHEVRAWLDTAALETDKSTAGVYALRVFVIVGNKCDESAQPPDGAARVPAAAAERVAREFRAERAATLFKARGGKGGGSAADEFVEVACLETSAREDVNVTELFTRIARACVDSKDRERLTLENGAL